MPRKRHSAEETVAKQRRADVLLAQGQTGEDVVRLLDEAMAGIFESERIPSTFKWEFSPKGQHIELGIAEMNLFILLSALGPSY